VRSQVGASALGVVLQVDASIRASTGNSADSGAAPYSVSAAFFLVMTSGMVSVTVTRATILPRIARSTRTATTLPWAATIRMRILGRCINGGFVADPPRKPRWTNAGVGLRVGVYSVGMAEGGTAEGSPRRQPGTQLPVDRGRHRILQMRYPALVPPFSPTAAHS
jgi:hypothetical protein